jgi:LysR family transcriptional regulator, nod-box dependent transcriptional activator
LLDATQPFEPNTDGRPFRISASDYTVLMLFGPIMQSLAAAAPKMSIHFVRLDLTLGERLANGEIDCGVLPAEFEPGLPSSALFDDSWVCAAWAGHPSIKNRLTIEEFLEHPHLSFSITDPGHVSVADEYLASNGHERRIVASTESFTAAPFLLRGTSLLTVVPRRLGERLREAADIRLLELPFVMPPLREKLVWDPRFTSSPRHVFIRAQLAAAASSL